MGKCNSVPVPMYQQKRLIQYCGKGIKNSLNFTENCVDFTKKSLVKFSGSLLRRIVQEKDIRMNDLVACSCACYFRDLF